MQEEEQEDIDDPQVGYSEQALDDMVVENVATPACLDDDDFARWEKFLTIKGDIAYGTSSDAESTTRQYRHTHTV
jgi:hypothetical protein